MSVLIDTESPAGSYADAIAHSPCMAVSDYVPADDEGLHVEVRL